MCHITSKNIRKTKIKVGSLNVRGLKQNVKENQLADNMRRYDLDILAIQETHLTGTGVKEIKTSDGRQAYDLFYTGSDTQSHHGIGIICDTSLDKKFERVSDRICKVTIKMCVKDNKTRDVTFMSTYAPTLSNSEKNPEIREHYYDMLDTSISSVNSRNLLIIGADFNAKTGSAHSDYPENMGPYGKGTVNSNGEHLLDLCRKK